LGYKKERKGVISVTRETNGLVRDVKREVSSLHDVHAKVVGPVAYDLALNFSRNTRRLTLIIRSIPTKIDLKNEIRTIQNKCASLSSEEGYSRGKYGHKF